MGVVLLVSIYSSCSNCCSSSFSCSSGLADGSSNSCGSSGMGFTLT